MVPRALATLRRMRRVGLGALVLSAWIAAPLVVRAKDEPKPKAEVVKLGFGWPAKLGADVTYRWTRTSTGKPAQGVTVVGRLNAAAEGETVRVELGSWRRDPSVPASATPPVAPQKVANIVDKKGALLRVDGDAPALAKASAARTWQMLVGSWAGAELEVGKEYETTTEGPVPVVPGGKLKSTLRFRAERLLACPGRPAVRCVELKLRSEPDRRSLAKLVAAMTAQSGAKADLTKTDLKSAGLEGGEEVTLVTEPDRLIPYRLAVTKTVELRPSAADPERRSQVDRTTWTYDYPAGAASK
jgi:hypothetical protein